MKRKYKLIGETKSYFSVRLHKVKALRDFAFAKCGVWIVKKKNLSHKENAWVFNEAKVFGYKLMLGITFVFGAAQICGNVIVSDTAKICGNVIVSDTAKIFENANVHGNTYINGDVVINVDADIFDRNRYALIGPIENGDEFVIFFKAKNNEIFAAMWGKQFSGNLNDFRKQAD